MSPRAQILPIRPKPTAECGMQGATWGIRCYPRFGHGRGHAHGHEALWPRNAGETESKQIETRLAITWWRKGEVLGAIPLSRFDLRRATRGGFPSPPSVPQDSREAPKFRGVGRGTTLPEHGAQSNRLGTGDSL